MLLKLLYNHKSCFRCDIILISEVSHVTKEAQRKEAVSRIQNLTEKFHLNSNMLDFFQKGSIYGLDYVEDSTIKDRNKLISSLIAECQNEYHSVVYYYFIVDVNFEGYPLELLNIFYVGQYEEDWDCERLSEDNEVYIRTYDLHSPDYSELGFVKVGSKDGNLIRIS